MDLIYAAQAVLVELVVVLPVEMDPIAAPIMLVIAEMVVARHPEDQVPHMVVLPDLLDWVVVVVHQFMVAAAAAAAIMVVAAASIMAAAVVDLPMQEAPVYRGHLIHQVLIQEQGQ